eukprot:8835570-Pyramimonas_sp.AAC.1
MSFVQVAASSARDGLAANRGDGGGARRAHADCTVGACPPRAGGRRAGRRHGFPLRRQFLGRRLRQDGLGQHHGVGGARAGVRDPAAGRSGGHALRGLGG